MMSVYKKDATLVEYTPDLRIVRYWDLKGCWVHEISEDPFDMESGEARVITAGIAFDRAEMHLPDEE